MSALRCHEYQHSWIISLTLKAMPIWKQLWRVWFVAFYLSFYSVAMIWESIIVTRSYWMQLFRICFANLSKEKFHPLTVVSLYVSIDPLSDDIVWYGQLDVTFIACFPVDKLDIYDQTAKTGKHKGLLSAIESAKCASLWWRRRISYRSAVWMSGF